MGPGNFAGCRSTRFRILRQRRQNGFSTVQTSSQTHFPVPALSCRVLQGVMDHRSGLYSTSYDKRRMAPCFREKRTCKVWASKTAIFTPLRCRRRVSTHNCVSTRGVCGQLDNVTNAGVPTPFLACSIILAADERDEYRVSRPSTLTR